MNLQARHKRDQEFKKELRSLLKKYGKDQEAGCSAEILAAYMFRAYNIVTHIIADLGMHRDSSG